MNYQIDENEYHSLELVRSQLDLITGLLALGEGQLDVITSFDLHSFLDQRGRELSRVIDDLSERQTLQRKLDDGQGVMGWWDWMHALRIAGGDGLHTPGGSEQRITEKLTKAVQINADMQRVLDTWLAILAKAGGQAMPVTETPKRPAKPRKHARRTDSA